MRQSAAKAFARLLPGAAPGLQSRVLAALRQLAGDGSSDVRRTVMKGLKKLGRQEPELVADHLSLLVPLLMDSAKGDKNIGVRLVAERALMYTLQLHSQPEVLQGYVRTVPNDVGRAVTDFCRRSMGKLQPGSDGESEEDM